MNAFDYKGQPSVWTRDAELKMINNGKILGLKRREQIREKEIQGHHPLQARKNKKCRQHLTTRVSLQSG